MAENGRLAALPFVKDAFEELMEERSLVVNLTLETAHTPDQDTVEFIRERMAKRLGSEAVIDQRNNPSILGGFRLMWRNRIIDMSLKGQLDKLRAFLKQE